MLRFAETHNALPFELQIQQDACVLHSVLQPLRLPVIPEVKVTFLTMPLQHLAVKPFPSTASEPGAVKTFPVF